MSRRSRYARRRLQVAKFMPPPMQQQQQQRPPRFEHPHSGQGILGQGGIGVGGPAADNQRMPGMGNNRDDFYDPKRMRRF